jgi:uncharacterized protein (DUF433 family)
MAWYHEYIECQEGVCDGYPILKGARTPVRAIIEATRMLDVKHILQSMPHLRRQQVEAAMAYYIHEPQRVDEDMRSNAAVLQALMSRS